MKTIKRWDFIRMVSKKVEGKYPQTEIYHVVQAVFECFADVLRDGNRFVVGNTFSLEPRYKESRKVSNFGNPITIPGHWEPHFKAYYKLKNACNELNDSELTTENDEEECR